MLHINIEDSNLRHGVLIGYKLSKLEWIWEETDGQYKKELTDGINEIISLTSIKNICINKLSYRAFNNIILNYYLKTNTEIYYAMLIGIAIQRYMLVGSSKSDKNNNELYNLSYSSLNTIPMNIISEKNELFNFIKKYKNKQLSEIIEGLIEYNQEGSQVKHKHDKMDVKNKPTLFLSYNEKDSPIANIIEKKLMNESNNKIEVMRYTRVPYKESFKKFMNSIQKSDYVLCIVSDSYLKSQACMYEIGEVIKDHEFEEKLLFVVLSENDRKYYKDNKNNLKVANIYGDEKNRINYIKYWEQEYKKLKEEIEGLNFIEAHKNPAAKLSEIRNICNNNISDFLTYLNDNNGKNFDELYSNNFRDILDLIFKNNNNILNINDKINKYSFTFEIENNNVKVDFKTKSSIREWFTDGGEESFEINVYDYRIDKINTLLEEMNLALENGKDLNDNEEKMYFELKYKKNLIEQELKIKAKACEIFFLDKIFQSYMGMFVVTSLIDYISKILLYDYYNDIQIKANDKNHVLIDFIFIGNFYFTTPVSEEDINKIFGNSKYRYIYGDVLDLGNKLLVGDVGVNFFIYLAENIINGKNLSLMSDKRVFNIFNYQMGLH